MSISIKTEPDDTAQADTPQEGTFPEAAVSDKRLVEGESSLAFPTTTALQDSGAGPSALPTKPQPKRLRKVDLPEELKTRDLDWFKSNQNLVPTTEESIASSGEADASVGAPTLSPRKKTARIVPSRRLPRRVPLEVALDVAESMSTTFSPAAEVPVGISGSSPELSTEAEKMEDTSAAMDIDEQGFSSGIIDPAAEHPIVENDRDRSQPTLHRWTLTLRLSQRTQLPNSVAHTLPDTMVNGVESNVFLADEHSSLDVPLSESAGISGTNLLPPPVPHRDTATTIPDTQNTTDPHSPSMGFRTQREPPSQVAQELTSAEHRSSVDRSAEPDHAPRAVCISLACYRLPELFSTIKLENDPRLFTPMGSLNLIACKPRRSGIC
ncbi:hypothetical protein BU15DRAFT_68959 [Melanogaster broomeanus]|nr:hypothetical protein BU15DRAFT_68959 [Melanogaster broomeanus]